MANIALRAARKAGDFMLRAMDRPEEFDIETKAHNDFVSNIDKTAKRLLSTKLLRPFRITPLLAKNLASGPATVVHLIIDPLDGTLNFLQGIPHFAVSIGVLKGRHYEHGVIYDPVRGEKFVASRALVRA